MVQGRWDRPLNTRGNLFFFFFTFSRFSSQQLLWIWSPFPALQENVGVGEQPLLYVNGTQARALDPPLRLPRQLYLAQIGSSHCFAS